MSEPQIKYVVGFLLDPTLSKVVLIRKLKPDYQRGLLNGVGGKIEKDESAVAAMNREFFEETGVEGLEWHHYLTLVTPGSHLSFFKAVGARLHQVQSMTPEQVGVYDVSDIMNRCDTMPNIRWCIQMARSFNFGEHTARFESVEIP